MSEQGPRGPRAAESLVSMSSARAAVLAALQDRGGEHSVRELADEFELHPNTVREHLDALVDEGLAARETAAPTGRGRPALVYRAVGGSTNVARDYQLLTEVLAEQVATLPDPRAASLQAGRTWGERMLAQGECAAGVGGVHQTMARMGFDPTSMDPDGVVVLRGCPIVAAARRHQDVVCTVHLGLARALVHAAGGDAEQVAIEPMAHPDGCLLRLPVPDAH